MVENLGRGRAGMPKLLEGGGVVSLGQGWGGERDKRAYETGPGHQSCRWELICHPNNLGEIEVRVELELGRVAKKKKKKGPRPLEQGAEVRVRTGRLLRYLTCHLLGVPTFPGLLSAVGLGLGAAAEKQFLVLVLPTHIPTAPLSVLP